MKTPTTSLAVSDGDGSGKTDNVQTATATVDVEPQARPAGAPAQLGDLVSDHAKGFEGFDPAVHAVDKQGAPVPKKGGGWQKKRGGNMRINAAPSSPSSPAPSSAPTQAPKPVKLATVNTLEAAKSTLNACVSLLVLILGEHWAPQTDQERQALTMATKNYFDAKGAVEVSPGWGLVLVVAAYSAPRLKHEATRSKLASIKVGMYRGWLWISGKLGGKAASA
jgi:hypothetical protein